MKSKKNKNNTSLTSNRNNYTSLRKHNNLIQSKYYLEASEQKLLYKVFEEIQQRNFTTPLVEINFKDFFRDFKGVLGKNITKKDFIKLIDTVQSKRIYLVKEDGDFIGTQWYTIHGNLNNTDVITLEINPYVFPYIEGLQTSFTWLKLSSIYSFKSFHTMRLYELLRQWFNSKNSVEFEIDTLKALLGIENYKSYNNYSNFNKYVLEKSTKEINKKSELTIDYKPIKKGKKVTAITFTKLKDELKVKTPTKPNTANENVEPSIFSGITFKNNLYEVLTEAEEKNKKNKENTIEGNITEEDGILKVDFQKTNNKINNKINTNDTICKTDDVYKKDIKKEKIYIPEELNMDKKLKHAIFAEEFKDYDFSNIDYKFMLLEAEESTFAKDGSDKITVKNYKLFTSILNKKIENFKKIMEQKKIEEEENMYWDLLTEEERTDAFCLNMSCKKYYNMINEKTE